MTLFVRIVLAAIQPLFLIALVTGCADKRVNEPDLTPAPLKIGEVVYVKGSQLHGTATDFKDGKVEVTWINRTGTFSEDTLHKDWFLIDALNRPFPDKRPITAPEKK